jgi:hypothetical protein
VFAALRNEIVVWIDDEKCSDLFVNLQIGHVLSYYAFTNIEGQICCMRASADTQAFFSDAVNVAAFFLTNSCKLSGPCPVSVRTSSDIRS